jgi:hypothetical protein
MGAPFNRHRPRDPYGLANGMGMNDRWLTILGMRARSLFRREQVERELEKELKFHLDQEMAEGRSRLMKSVRQLSETLEALPKSRRNVGICGEQTYSKTFVRTFVTAGEY